jgi:hypothetical protein
MYARADDLILVAAAARRKGLPISSYIRSVMIGQARLDLVA